VSNAASPPSVEGICATLLDTMSTTQQIALKVAAMIGEQFTLTLVRAVFPISALKDGLEDEWSALVRLGLVRAPCPALPYSPRRRHRRR
jgi:predicted ATPase